MSSERLWPEWLVEEIVMDKDAFVTEGGDEVVAANAAKYHIKR